jgi:glycosyltransferase involved in cell wall biosynthesis
MGTPLKCTVVIPTYNRERLLRHTLDSLVRQDLGRDAFEVIVVDDGSSDGTVAMVDGYRERLNLHYRFQPDDGYRAARARNIGLAMAEAGVCVLVDSGVALHSGCLAAHVAAHEAVAGPATVCGYVYCFAIDDRDAELINRAIDPGDPDGTIAALRRKGEWLDIREEFYARYTDDIHDLPAPWQVFWTCNVSVDTAQARAVGGFDESFRGWGGEDIDLGYRLHREGARFVLSRAAAAVHVPHEKDFRANLETAQRNYEYMDRKYGDPVVRLLRTVPPEDFFALNDVARGTAPAGRAGGA